VAAAGSSVKGSLPSRRRKTSAVDAGLSLWPHDQRPERSAMIERMCGDAAIPFSGLLNTDISTSKPVEYVKNLQNQYELF
jgi:hypothetical protein